MIIFLYGEDSFRSKQKLEEIIGHYKEVHKSGLNLVYFDAMLADSQTKGNNFSDLMDNFKIAGMFAEKKLIILKNAFGNLKFQEEFFKEFKSINSLKDVVVIYEDEPVDQRTKFFKALKKYAKSQEFNLLSERYLKEWLSCELKKHKAEADFPAQNLLLASVGNDLWRMQNEVKKLSDFKRKGIIGKKDVELLVKPKIDSDIFKTIEALALKNKKQALAFIKNHIEQEDHPLYILSMIAFQFRNLLIIKEMVGQGIPYSAIAKKSGLHPFVVKKSFELCNRFSFEDLKKSYLKVFQIDSDIKTGKIDAEIALDLFVAEI